MAIHASNLAACNLARSLSVMRKRATVRDALAFVREQGVVLVSAKGPAPTLTETLVGESIKGSWWTHPQSRQIFKILEGVAASDQILVCRLVGGKITLVHRRLWPALVRLAKRFAPEQLAQVRQEHTSSGRHVNREVPFPQWVPPDVATKAIAMDEAEALSAFKLWLMTPTPASRRARTRNTSSNPHARRHPG